MAQAGIGNVVAPSVFATLQSAAAGGYGVAAVHGVVQAAGAAIGSGAGAVFWWANKDEESPDAGREPTTEEPFDACPGP